MNRLFVLEALCLDKSDYMDAFCHTVVFHDEAVHGNRIHDLVGRWGWEGGAVQSKRPLGPKPW